MEDPATPPPSTRIFLFTRPPLVGHEDTKTPSPEICFVLSRCRGVQCSIGTPDVEQPPSRRHEAAEPLAARQQRNAAVGANRQKLSLLKLVEPRANHRPHSVARTERGERQRAAWG